VYVKTTRVRRGNRVYEYLSLVEAVRDGGRVRHDVVARLGEASALRASGELDRIVAALAAHSQRSWCDESGVEVEDARSAGAVAAVATHWARLGLDRHFAAMAGGHDAPIADAVFAMVANRLCAPRSKRALAEWVGSDVVMPAGFREPAAHHYYRALDVVAEAKEATETHLYGALTDLTNLDLRLVCYDLTSTYFEGQTKPSPRFESRAFGYSRDHRGDRPQVVIGLLVTGDGIPIAHHVFAGNTADVSTLPGVLDDLQSRFGIGAITMVADRGLISADNVKALSDKGFGHILATRLHRDADVAAVLAASTSPEAVWAPCPSAGSAVCEVTHDGRRFIVAMSAERMWRDTRRTAELIARTSKELRALENRVGAGRLKDKAKIAAAASRILSASGVARLFDVEIGEGRFLYHYDEAALDYEEKLLAGRWVVTTSLSPEQASAAEIVVAYRRLLEVESTFRVLKDLIELRPVFHWTEDRVRAHVAVCVLAAVIEALMEADLRAAGVADPDIADQVISPRRALRELGRIRRVTLTVAERTIERDTRHSGLQDRILAAFGVEAASWAPAAAG
jgi:transposase